MASIPDHVLKVRDALSAEVVEPGSVVNSHRALAYEAIAWCNGDVAPAERHFTIETRLDLLLGWTYRLRYMTAGGYHRYLIHVRA